MSLALPGFEATYGRIFYRLHENLYDYPKNEQYEQLIPIPCQPVVPYHQPQPIINHMKRQRQYSQQNEGNSVEEPSSLNPTSAKRQKRSCFIVKGKEMKAFFGLIADELIQDFLEMDSCMRIADNYLIAMVFAYFKRAGYSLREYSRTNFFIALYLANDVEEDEEEIKYEIFPWALGKKWKKKYPGFLAKRDKLLKRIDYRAIVSRRCCEEIMAIETSHIVWSRQRLAHHGGAMRSYMLDSEDNYPRGPDATPRLCHLCDATDSQYDSASPSSYSWYISSTDSSPETNCSSVHSRFDMKGLKKNLPEQESDDVWPTIEE
ncbi:speedy protein A-like [Haliotis asinina]|uniref:speedy protein A-like n=1 Tax=Haliotis asinina TaxID=109174 RepID=UPI0035320860